MFRLILVVLAVAALTVSAGAYPTQWDGAADGDLTITLGLGCYIQIQWQDTDMVFDYDGDTAEDYYCNELMGTAYLHCPDPDGKTPSDAWAGSEYYCGTDGMYYMTNDGARIFVRSNNPLSMAVHTNGDLHYYDPDTSTDLYIPTWFTMCACPFMVGGSWFADGQVPESGVPLLWGSYLYDTGGFVIGDSNPTYFFPNEWAFPCAPASNTYTWGPLVPGVEGTIQWLARIQRFGMLDQGGDYATHLDVTFSSP
jgi:hypothetical protein